MKTLLYQLIVGILLITLAETQAATPTFVWAVDGGSDTDTDNAASGNAVAVDPAGNSYVAGHFRKTAVFGTTTLVTTDTQTSGNSDAFLVKYDSGGHVVWALQAGGSSDDEAWGVAVDQSGNSYVTGYFHSSANFGPVNLVSLGWTDCFVAKYDTDGNLMWVRQIGGSVALGRAIAVGAAGEVFVTGDFIGTADFGGAVLVGSPPGAGVPLDTFLAKYDADGNLLWAKQATATGFINATGVGVDSFGNSYVVGSFSEQAVFDVVTLSAVGSSYVFVAKYDPTGSLIWVHQGGSPASFAHAWGIAVDAVGNSHITGLFNGTAKFGDAPPITTRTLNDADMYIAKYNAAGDAVWARQVGGEPVWYPKADAGLGIAVDASGNSFVTGFFSDTAAFGDTSLSACWQVSDGFVAKYDATGTPQWAIGFGGCGGADRGNGIAVDSAGMVHVTGQFVSDGIFGNFAFLHAPRSQYMFAAMVSDLNSPPTINGVTGPANPVPVGSRVTASANFVDPDTDQPHVVTFTWNDGSTDTVSVGAGVGSASASHTYTSPGVYTVGATVTDTFGSVASSVFQFVVVYDPYGGYVTGGGWINSPPAAYTLNPSLTGKATFGFVSKYLKGANVPTGNTEFQFKVANLNFKSTAYQWLVIAGPKAQYKGSGTINGTGDYGFMLTAIDGQVNGGGGTDKFRIKIWDHATGGVVYDNQMGETDDAIPSTAIQGGSIVIHKD